MSSSTRFTKKAAIGLAVVGTAAVVAAAIIGFTGWPPVKVAAAAPEHRTDMLGVDQNTAVQLGAQVRVADKLGDVTAAAKNPHEGLRLTTPAKKAAAPIPKPRRVIRASVRSVSSVTRTHRIRAGKSSSRGGWRSARASWYGPGFYGNTMAGGGKLRRDSMVVAHRSLPFGTRVLISYHGREVTAVVRDRGPFVGGRTFDLGPGIARALGFGGVGTIKYKLLGR